MSEFKLSSDYLPDSIFNSLSRKAIVVFRQYQRLFNVRKEVISLEYAHITPSLSWLAGKTGLSRFQVSRANSELATAGLIERRQLRTLVGDWKNNVVQLGAHFTGLWKTFQAKKKGNKNTGLQKTANIESFKDSEDNYYKDCMNEIRNILGIRPKPAPA